MLQNANILISKKLLSIVTLILITSILFIYFQYIPNVLAAPNAPSNLQATGISDGQVRFTWQDNSSDESCFILSVSTSQSGPFFSLTSTNAGLFDYIPDNTTSFTLKTNTSLTPAGVDEGNLYYFRLQSQTNGTFSSSSNIASAKPLMRTPTYLRAKIMDATHIQLMWTDNSHKESAFVVERKIGTGSWQVIANQLADAPGYTDSTASNSGSGYSYRVKAYKQDTNTSSDYSNTAQPATSVPITPLPVVRGILPQLGTRVNEMAVKGNTLYVASNFYTSSYGLTAFDITQTTNPVPIATQHPLSSGVGSGLAVGDHRLLYNGELMDITDRTDLRVMMRSPFNGSRFIGDVLLQPRNIQVTPVDLANPASPVVLPNITMGANVIDVQGTKLIGAAGNKVSIADITSITSPTVFGALTLDAGDNITTIALKDNKIYAYGYVSGNLYVIDASVPSNLRLLGKLFVQKLSGDYATPKMIVNNGYVYLTSGYGSPAFGFKIVNATNPTSLTLASSPKDKINFFGGIKDNILFATTYVSGYEKISLYDLASPGSPSLQKSVPSTNESESFDMGFKDNLMVSGSRPVYLVDISNPDKPRKLSTLLANGEGAKIIGNYVYIAGYTGSRLDYGLYIIDISDPENPRQIDVRPYSYPGFDIARMQYDPVRKILAYTEKNVNGSHPELYSYKNMFLDVSNPASPTVLATIESNMVILASKDNKYYATHSNKNCVQNGSLAALSVIDATIPTNPHTISEITMASSCYSDIYDITFKDNNAYLSMGSGGMVVVNISDPTKPSIVSRYDPTDHSFDDVFLPRSVAIDGNFAFVIHGTFYSGVGGDDIPLIHVLDISNPADITKVSVVPTNAANFDLSFVKNRLFISGSTNPVMVYDPYNTSSNEPRALAMMTTTATSGVKVGDNYMYDFTAYNPSSQTITNATITDPLSSRIRVLTGTISDNGQYNSTTNTITWTFPKIDPYGSLHVYFNAVVNN